MNSNNKINRAAWNQVQSVKDYLLVTLTDAHKQGLVTGDLAKLLSLVSNSVDAAYQRSAPSFEREVKSATEK